MTFTTIRCLVLAVAASLASAFTSSAGAAPIFRQVSPTPTDYVFAVGGDFTLYPGTSLGNVTAGLEAPNPGSPTGCSSSDFDGFVAGGIALLSRGTCVFGQKAANAAAAGAVGAIIYSNVPGGALNFAFSIPAGIPTIFTTLEIGTGFAQAPLKTPIIVTLIVDDVNAVAQPLPSVPLPAALPLLAAALTALGFVGRSRRCGLSRE